MDGDLIVRGIYLLLLVSAIAGWVLIESRGRMGQALRQALAWLLIFVGLAAGYGLWQDMAPGGQRQVAGAEGGRIVIDRGNDNHFYLRLSVQGTALRFMIDTGASGIVLSDRDAKRLGIDARNLVFLGSAQTANGTIRTAQVTLRDVELEGRRLGDLPAMVGDGPLGVSLLGMAFLDRFGKVEMTRDRLILSD